MERFNVEEYVRLISKYRIPILFIVPPVAVMLTKRPELLKNSDMSSVIAVFSSAAALPTGVEKELRALLPSLIITTVKQGYGMTETTGAVTRTGVHFGAADPPGSVGKVLPFGELKIVCEETGRSLGPNKHGEIAVRGPLNMKGYFGDPQATADIIDRDGWLRTGDLGYYDKKGYVFVVDRAKELIKCRGNQVAPAELEDILLTHPDIADTAVVGLPDELSGELPLAFVVKKPGTVVTERQIQDYVAAKVSRYKQLTGGVRFVMEIPKLPSGKILRRKLRDSLRTSPKL
jgi:acyl-CoA synthetase (AMP-forming)/AMP-acid ligase II